MPNLLTAEITGYETLTRPIWPETEEGGLYRELLISSLQASPGYAFRAFPMPNVVQNVFGTKADLQTFLLANCLLLADMMGRAKVYYETDPGCSLALTLVWDTETGPHSKVILDVTDPDEYALPS